MRWMPDARGTAPHDAWRAALGAVGHGGGGAGLQLHPVDLVFGGFFLANGVATDLPMVGKMKDMPFEGQMLQPGDRIIAWPGRTARPDDPGRDPTALPPRRRSNMWSTGAARP
jgi:hypothetical protein